MTDTAMIPSVPGATGLGALRPQNPRQLAYFCNLAAKSGLFTTSAGRGRTQRLITEAEAFLLASQGIELGLSPLQSLRELNIIDGRVDIPASVRAALIAASPKVTDWFVESDDTFCTINAKRRDRERGCKVTILLKDLPSAWRERHKDHLEDGLYARAVRRISRQYFPDLNLGMETDSYAVENVIDIRDTRLAVVEEKAGTSDGDYGLHDECGGVLSLHTNTRTGGAFLLCEKCNATFPPPQEVRDAMRATPAGGEVLPAPGVHWDETEGRWLEDDGSPQQPTPEQPTSLPESEAGDVEAPNPDAIPPASPSQEEGPTRINPDDIPW